MRSRIWLGGILTIMLLIWVGTCRRQTSVSQSSSAPTEQGFTPDPPVAPPENWPGLSEVPTTAVADRQSGQPAAAAPAGPQLAVLKAEDPEAVINVRSQPSAVDEPIGFGRVGDRVTVARSAPGDDGFTWHYVNFKDGGIEGWVREDLLTLQPMALTAEGTPQLVSRGFPQGDVLKQALTEQCGSTKAIEAYFMTQSHIIYICKMRNQRLYLSQESGTDQVITANDIEAVGGSYLIGNGDFEYRLDSGSFVVVRFDDSGRQEEVLRESVIHSERF